MRKTTGTAGKRNSQKRTARNRHKVCNSCGHGNPINVSKCKDCGKTRFFPSWVLGGHQPQVGVKIAIRSHLRARGKDNPHKWWPGGSASFHIPHCPVGRSNPSSIRTSAISVGIYQGDQAHQVTKGPASARTIAKLLLPPTPPGARIAIDLEAREIDFEQVLESFGQLSTPSPAQRGIRDACSLLEETTDSATSTPELMHFSRVVSRSSQASPSR
jgi:hypothetical protein